MGPSSGAWGRGLKGRTPHVIAAIVLGLVIAAMFVIAMIVPGDHAVATTVPASLRPASPAAVRVMRHRRPVYVPVLTVPIGGPDRFVRVPILMYHRVSNVAFVSPTEAEFTVRPAVFSAQMDWLASNGYTPIREIQLFDALVHGTVLPRKPVLITFDDGYVDAAGSVLRTLVNRRRHWPATFFVITGRIGKGQFLSWPQIRLLERSGMDIGSHTVWHTRMATLSPGAQRFEAGQSARVLARGLHHPVYWFAYPYGSFDASAARALDGAGYMLGFTTVPGVWQSTAQRLTLPRVLVPGGADLAQFAVAVRSGY
jgi:peptidoglycan/xylan/chitin deacetylase (PgdA/CDA1 family)